MPLSRLLALALLLVFFSPAFTAQAQSVDAPASRPSEAFRGADSAVSAVDQFSFIPADGHQSARLRTLEPEWQAPSVECYAIRSYLVVRDAPHSDATHARGYSTCVPAARIRMYSTVVREER